MQGGSVDEKAQDAGSAPEDGAGPQVPASSGSSDKRSEGPDQAPEVTTPESGRPSKVPVSLKNFMYSRITSGSEPEGDNWEVLTSKLPKNAGGPGTGPVAVPQFPLAPQWNLMQVQLEGYKDLRQYRAGASFS